MQVLPGLHQVRPGPGSCNVFLWQDGRDLVLIDAGLDHDADVVVEAMQKHSSQAAKVTHILLTHYHQDHAGALARLAAATGARLAAHQEDADAIGAGGRNPLTRRQTLGPEERIVESRLSAVPIDVPIRDGADLPGGLVAVHTPGHTAGHTSFYHPVERFLLAGDAVFNFPPLCGPTTAISRDVERAMQSVERLIELEFDVVCFGHGPPLAQDASARLRQLVEASLGA